MALGRWDACRLRVDFLERVREMVRVMPRREHHQEDRRHMGEQQEEDRMATHQEEEHIREVSRTVLDMEGEARRHHRMDMLVELAAGAVIHRRLSRMVGSREVRHRHNLNRVLLRILRLQIQERIIQAQRRTTIIQTAATHHHLRDQSQNGRSLQGGREQERRRDVKRKSAEKPQSCNDKKKKQSANCVPRRRRPRGNSVLRRKKQNVN